LARELEQLRLEAVVVALPADRLASLDLAGEARDRGERADEVVVGIAGAGKDAERGHLREEGVDPGLAIAAVVATPAGGGLPPARPGRGPHSSAAGAGPPRRRGDGGCDASPPRVRRGSPRTSGRRRARGAARRRPSARPRTAGRPPPRPDARAARPRRRNGSSRCGLPRAGGAPRRASPTGARAAPPRSRS